MRPATLTAAAACLVLTVTAATPPIADSSSEARAHTLAEQTRTLAEQTRPLSEGTRTLTEGTAEAAARAAREGIRFGPCPPELHMEEPVECGTFTVPRDYTRLQGDRLTLRVGRARATGEDGTRRPRRQGALVFRTGSPGTDGVYFPLASQLASWRRIHSAYDLVGWTPRGVGGKHPLSCQSPEEFTAAPSDAPERPGAAAKKARRAAARTYAAGCARSGGSGLRHLTAADNARDLEVLRAALGERQLNYMGVDHGALVGALHATLFPGHLRRLVLDSVPGTDPRTTGLAGLRREVRAVQRRWEDFLGWVARHDREYELGDSPERVQYSYDKVRATLAARPAGGVVGPRQLQSAFMKAVRYDDHWPIRALALSAYLHGQPDFLTQQASPVREAAAEKENSAAVTTAGLCNDANWPRDWPTWDNAAGELAATAPFAAWEHTWARLPCASWPSAGSVPQVRVPAGPGALVLAAERDAITPYENARTVRDRISGAVLVTQRGGGSHGVGGAGDDCVDAHLETYLLHGRLPSADVSCPAPAEPEPLGSGQPDDGKAPRLLRAARGE